MAVDQQDLLNRDFEYFGDLRSEWAPDTSAPSTAWDAYDTRMVATSSTPAVTLTPSVEADPGSSSTFNLMKVTSSAGGDDAHREWFLRSDKRFQYSEIRSVIYGHGTWASAANFTQQGHVHRAQRYGSGHMRAFVAWHDVIFGLPTITNVGLWEANGASTLNLHFVNANLSISPVPERAVTHSSRTSNVVTIHVPGRHRISVNDHLDTVLPGGDLGATNVTVTGVAGPAITYADTGTDATNGGGGSVRKHSADNPYQLLSNFPYVFASRLLPNDTFQAKMYRVDDPEPPWSAGVTYSTASFAPVDHHPTGPGFSGVLVGHMGNSESVRFGLPVIRQLGPS